ncbi:hypothetical protein KJZ71_04880 [Patescibacteria group bacterium]|jgi:uncharacterized membrane protein YczE|uniref:Uncharacterized protein n=1 Tax=candidate division WWE3 bacterium TaxID=2053526 RepID=A0A928TUY0_UNCKA|nr:hypothetical protein [candidate division WWE3 bacterium]MCL4733102.1 hypothetical protein [Patescibacteria group bacterium]MDL1953468.1 DHHC zinc finger domain-containing protein [Candidatus Uhrbacteria bacterium UHB]RIL00483.1 MAG: hypothetical protein DCC77_02870 [Candidatus Uhrbacteria bacterium]
MLFWTTLAIVFLLVILAISLNYLALAFYEFRGAFIYTMVGILLFIVGAAIYLSFALPSLAGEELSLFGKNKDISVTQDSVQGLELLEE